MAIDIYKVQQFEAVRHPAHFGMLDGPYIKELILSCQPVSADVLSVMFGHRWLLLSCHLFTILK